MYIISILDRCKCAAESFVMCSKWVQGLCSRGNGGGNRFRLKAMSWKLLINIVHAL